MNRYAQFLGSEGINVSLSSVDYDPYTQLNYLFKLDGEYVDSEINKKLEPEIQALERLIEESTSTGQFTCVTAGDSTITIGGTTTAPTVAVNTACFSNCQGTVTSVCGGTGTTSSGGNTPAISLTDTGVSAGSYTSTNITVDAQGRITAASNGSGGGGGAGVANVTASHGLSSSGGTNPNITIIPAQTDITSIKNTALNVGRDDDNLIKFNTDNEIVFEVGGTDGVTFKSGGEIEATSLDISGSVDIDGGLETDALCIDGTQITRTAAQINAARPGTVTSVTAGNTNITIGGTATDPTIAVNSACFTDCEGTVTSVTAGTGLTATSGITPVISIDATQSSLSSIKNSCLVVGRDNANFIQFATNNQIAFYVASCGGVIFKSGGEIEATSLDISCDVDIACTLSLAGTDIDASATEINQIHGITDGTVAANKAVIVDCNKDITGFRNITLTGELDAASLDVEGNADINGTLETDALSLNGTLISRTAAEINAARPGTVTSVCNGDATITIGGTATDPTIAVNSTCFSNCTGTVGSVGLSGAQGINIIGGSPITGCGTICLKINDTCNTAWNAKTTCTGTTTPSNTQTFTNKSGCISQWTNDSGYITSACNGTVTSITTTGAYLTGGTITSTGNIGIDYNCARSWDAKTTCTGTVTSVAIGGTQGITVVDGSPITENGTINLKVTDACDTAWNAKTTCTGTVFSAGLALSASAGGTILGVKDVCNTAWNAKTTCTGTVQSITTTGVYLTGGTITCTGNIGLNYNCATAWDAKTTCTGTVKSVTGGNATITIGGTATDPTIAVNASCFTNNSGTVTCVTGGDGLTGNITTSGSLAVDTSVARTNIDEVFSCDLTVQGDLTVTGDITCLETIISTTSALSVTNNGTGPALVVNQTGCNDIIDFRDDNNSVFYIEDGGNIGLGTTDPNYKLDVTGDINSQNHILSSGVNLDTLFLTEACNGTVTCIDVSGGICGGPITTSGTLSIDTACNTKWDQSTCPGINATGTVQSITTTGVYLTGGTITCTGDIGLNYNCATSWDAKTTCTGTVTNVSCGDATISIGGTATSPTVAVNSACFSNCEGTVTSVAIGGTQGITVVDGSPITESGTINLKITDACNTAWNAKTTCTGTVSTLSDLGITSTAAELNYTTNVTSDIQAQLDAKGTGSVCSLGDLGITATSTELNYTTNVTSDIQAQLDAKGTGTTTPSNTQTFTNKSGCISQWTNDCSYGKITTVTAGNGLTGGASTGTATLNVGAGTAITVAADTVSVNSTCNSTWNAKTTCTGTVSTLSDLGITATAAELNYTTDVTSNIQAQLDAKGTGSVCSLGDLGITATAAELNYTTDVTSNIQAQLDAKGSGTTTPSNTQTFTNKSGCISQWTNDSNYTTCTGDITAVTAGNGLTGGALTGAATLNVGAGTAITVAADTVSVNSTCNSTWNANTTCTGTTTPSNTQTFTNKSGCISQWTNDSNYTTCTGTTTPSNTQTFTNKSGCISQWTNDSNYNNCTGNICSSTAQCIFDTADNFCIGPNAGEDFTSGGNNVLIGQCAGRCITTGSHNISMGFRAGEKTSDKGCNVSLGRCANFCGQGCANTAIGPQAMQNSTASNSIGIGKCTLLNATGNSNTAIGAQALQGITTGEQNFGLGAIAGYSMQTGNGNVFIGEQAHRYATGGDNNIAIGKYAGRCHSGGTKTAGSNSIFIGQDAKAGAASTSNEIVIGCGAIGQGTNTAMIGNSSTTHLYIYGCYSTVSDRRDKTCICDLELGLEFIKELKPKTFNTIADRCNPTGSITGKKHGFIAQDIIALEGEDSVIVSNKNPDRLSYTGEHIIPILVKGMQEQQLVIDNLVSEVKDLKNKLQSS